MQAITESSFAGNKKLPNKDLYRNCNRFFLRASKICCSFCENLC